MTTADIGRAVPFATCEIIPEARAAALAVLESGWVTTGPRTAQFEHQLARWVGAEHAVAVSSCTAAIELSLRALRLPAGSPVLSPTLTFCGAVHAIVHAGLRPVLVDVDEATLTLRPRDVASAAERSGARAMVVQHMAGYPAPVAELAAAAGLDPAHVVEDAAHGLGAAAGPDPVGSAPGATCFSFYATKNLPIGEGGAVTTADPELADLLRQSRQHGMSRDAWRRYHPGSGWRYSVEVDGMKANFTDLQAAIGSAQLTRLEGWQARRAELADRYDAALRDVPGLTPPPRPVTGRHAWHLYVLRVGPGYRLTRDALAAALAERGVGTSVHFIPVHHFPYFRALLGAPHLPVADQVFDGLLSLPLHPALADADVDHVCALITDLGRRGGSP
ncbi:DegT/DnrJ/EryC1/StrS family aminotransferase [Pseudonocardia acidicola]|uniref:DegT/DnrJ/EryC1/StrS family aminotransferase n=1 Tax=Pseudonocardia acidicola TaxID=2724939 RepID=A0ABX1S8R0_9PSEU|nr:DegT/DnrJ/EryC1/StrS family aminotransferase [Pseudonocardia acidicola]NMH96649.1 DegT/DnrJ/EryC1/StrS family aminotransferase [Pseudonocardia acidicola]